FPLHHLHPSPTRRSSDLFLSSLSAPTYVLFSLCSHALLLSSSRIKMTTNALRGIIVAVFHSPIIANGVSMARKNAFYAQSGGVTSVINASAAGVIEAARNSDIIDKVYAGRNGIIGALTEDLIDTSL